MESAPAPSAPASPASTGSAAAGDPSDAGTGQAVPEEARRVIAYYFHRTVRCPTCLAIERQAHEALEASYGAELSSGTLEWYAVNVEESPHAHFERDFELTSQALVLVEMHGDRVVRWKMLPQVWELVEDPDGFQDYVVRAVAVFLSGEPPGPEDWSDRPGM